MVTLSSADEKKWLEGLATPQLEQMLRSPTTDSATRTAIANELSRRYQEEIPQKDGGPKRVGDPPRPPRSSTEATRAPSPPGPVGPVAPTPAQYPAAAPAPWQMNRSTEQPPLYVQPATPQTASTNNNSSATGCITAALIAAAIAAAIYFFQNLSGDESPLGTCITPIGNCPMQVSLPPGSSCTCVNENGLTESFGYVSR